MTEFEKAEKKGRDIIENLIKGRVVNYEFTKDPYNPIDLFVTGYVKTAAVEIKYREHYKSETVEKLGGMYLMKHKYDDLLKAANSGYTPMFATIYEDKIVIWNLNAINPQWEHKTFPKATVVDKGDMDYEMTYLHIHDAIKEYETKDFREDSKGKDD